jgi:hypothetical protein
MKRLLALALVLCLTPVVATAQSIDIAWTDMGPGCTTGEQASVFACNTNSALQNRTIVTSFTSHIDLPQFVGMTANIRVISSDPTLPNWWRMGAGECRSNGWGAVSSPANLGLVECADPWGTGSFIGGVTHISGDGGANQARVVADLATDVPQQLSAGVEYYGEAITLTVLRTTGTGSCTGCLSGACLVLESIELFQVAGSPGGDVITLTNPSDPFISWNGGTNCVTVAAKSSSWGQVKTLYR